MASMIIRLPPPPSVNCLYRNVRGVGRVKTGRYKRWLVMADGYWLAQKRSLRPFVGPLALSIRVPAKGRADCSNLIKAIEDYLVTREITPDDKHNWKVSIERSPEVLDCCEVEITEIGAPV